MRILDSFLNLAVNELPSSVTVRDKVTHMLICLSGSGRRNRANPFIPNLIDWKRESGSRREYSSVRFVK